jgi:hypothetical protein
MKSQTYKFLNIFFAVVTATAFFIFLTGCATTDNDENLSSRPWNTPKSWETGVPSGLLEGR